MKSGKIINKSLADLLEIQGALDTWNSVSGLFRAVMWKEYENEMIHFDPSGRITTLYPLEKIGKHVISPDASMAVVAGMDESGNTGFFLYSMDDDEWVATLLPGYLGPDLRGSDRIYWHPDSISFWLLTCSKLFHYSVIAEQLTLVDEKFMECASYEGCVFAFP